MVIFTWITLGIVGALLLASAVCWGVFLMAESSDWKKLAIKIFRIGLLFVLFYMNVYIYVNVFRAASGEEPAPPVVESTED